MNRKLMNRAVLRLPGGVGVAVLLLTSLLVAGLAAQDKPKKKAQKKKKSATNTTAGATQKVNHISVYFIVTTVMCV